MECWSTVRRRLERVRLLDQLASSSLPRSGPWRLCCLRSAGAHRGRHPSSSAYRRTLLGTHRGHRAHGAVCRCSHLRHAVISRDRIGHRPQQASGSGALTGFRLGGAVGSRLPWTWGRPTCRSSGWLSGDPG